MGLVFVLRSGGIRSDEGQIDSVWGRRKLNLRLFCSFMNTLYSHVIIRQIRTSLRPKFVQDVVDEFDIKVFTTQMGVTVIDSDGCVF